VAAKARHVTAFKKSFSGTVNPGTNPSSCGRWVLGEGELKSEVVKIEGLLSAHATELAHLHAFYAVSTLSGERQLHRERLAQEQREGRGSSVGKLDTGGTGYDDHELRLTMLQFSRLVRDCTFVGEGDSLSAVDALYLAALCTERLSRAKSEAHASAPTAQRPSTAGNSRMPATGASRWKECGGGKGGGDGVGVGGGAKAVYVKPGGGGSSLAQDSGAGMGLLSFLASVVLLAAAAHPPPTASATAPATSAKASDSQNHPAGGKVPFLTTTPSSLSAAVAAVLREQLLPRTCTLLYLWHQPSYR
jgi:hypothetical protein